MLKTWEVDPETRSKLLLIQKSKGNDRCCDCGAPSPQWASPKFGTFICLNCAGTHRGLGVHISFVRSITMDAFKVAEIQRMELSGNEAWKQFYDRHTLTITKGLTFEDSTIKERYEGDVGEEWKARLTAKVEGKEYVPVERKPTLSRSNTPSIGGSKSAGNGRARLDPSRSTSPANSEVSAGRKERNEAYFAKLGSENSLRSDNLPPSQGGKYGGFGGRIATASSTNTAQLEEEGMPGMDDFQKDPVAALTKGFGWFATTLGKSAKTVNDSYLQPAAKSIAESDLAFQARTTASQVSQGLQSGARGAADSFTRFVEGGPDNAAGVGPGGQRSARGFEPERKDFWDSFAALGEDRKGLAGLGAIGTAAMKKSPSSATVTSVGGGAVAGGGHGSTAPTTSTSPTGGGKGKDDSGGWDDNW